MVVHVYISQLSDTQANCKIVFVLVRLLNHFIEDIRVHFSIVVIVKYIINFDQTLCVACNFTIKGVFHTGKPFGRLEVLSSSLKKNNDTVDFTDTKPISLTILVAILTEIGVSID